MEWIKKEMRDKLLCSDLISLLKLARKKEEYYRDKYEKFNMLDDFCESEKYKNIVENIEKELEKYLMLFNKK